MVLTGGAVATISARKWSVQTYKNEFNRDQRCLVHCGFHANPVGLIPLPEQKAACRAHAECDGDGLIGIIVDDLIGGFGAGGGEQGPGIISPAVGIWMIMSGMRFHTGLAPVFSRHFQLGIALNNPGVDGKMSQACGPVDPEFAFELLPVFFDGFDADAKFRGSLFVESAAGDELQHLKFPGRQFLDLLPGREIQIGRFWIFTNRAVEYRGIDWFAGPAGNTRVEARWSMGGIGMG